MADISALLIPNAAASLAITNTQFYNVVPDLCCAIKQFADKKAAEAVDVLGPVFVNHGVHERYGLMMVHRHFDMVEGEVLVETPNKDHSMSVAMAWTVAKSNTGTFHIAPSDNKIWNSLGFEPELEGFVQPNSWAFDNKIKPVPFEFHSTRQEIDEADGADALPHEFIQELYAALCSLGLESVFGLRRIRTNVPSFETTPEGLRVNVTQFGGTPPKIDDGEFVKVVYLIGADGKCKGGTFCVVHSGSSCHHCSSHTK